MTANSPMRSFARVVLLSTPIVLSAQRSSSTSKHPTRLESGLSRIVITGDELRRQNVASLETVFQGEVPGFVALSPATDMVTTWRVRGIASPTAWAVPRVYLNNVELDSPSSLHEVSPDIVDSIVVYPGAVGGTLSGIDATGGVVRVYTRGGRAKTPLTFVGSLIDGYDKSLTSGDSKGFNSHSLFATGGDDGMTYAFGGGFGGQGEWAPSYSDRARHWLGSVTSTGRYGSLTLFGRSQRDASTPPDTRGTALRVPQFLDDTTNHTTYGASADITLASTWTVHASGGVHRTTDASIQYRTRQRFPGDTLLSSGRDDARRTSYVVSSTYTLPQLGALIPSLTVGGEQSRLVTTTESRTYPSGAPSSTFVTANSTRMDGKRLSYYGTFGLTTGKGFVLNVGLQQDRKDGDGDLPHPHLHPRADAAYAWETSTGRLTIRGAYGVTSASIGQTADFVARTTQELRATEAGFDWTEKDKAFGVTAFHQQGTNGVDGYVPVVLGFGTIPYTTGEVRNDGLSAYLRADRGPLGFRAEYSTVRPRVTTTSPLVTTGYPVGVANDLPNTMGHAAIILTSDSVSGNTRGRSHLSFDVHYTGPHQADSTLITNPSLRSYRSFFTYDVNTSIPMDRQTAFIAYVHNLTNSEHYDRTNLVYTRGRRIGFGIRFGEQSPNQ